MSSSRADGLNVLTTKSLDGIETTMRQSGLYSTTEIRPVVETRMWALLKLGRADYWNQS